MILGGRRRDADRDQRRRQVARTDHHTTDRGPRVASADVISAASVAEERFRGEPAITVTAGELSATFLPGPGDDRRLDALRRSSAPRPARWAGGPAGWLDAGPAAAGAVGQPSRRLALPGRRRRCRPRRVGPRHRRQRAADPRRARGPAGLARRAVHDRCGRAGVRAAIDVDNPAFPFPHRIEVTATASDRRLDGRHHDRPDGHTRRARGLRLASVPAAAWDAPPPAGDSGCRTAPTSPSTTAASQPAARWPRPAREPTRSGGVRSTTCTSSAATAIWPSSRDDVRDLDAPRRRLPVCPGVGAAGPPVRRARADDDPDQQPRRRHGAAGRTGRTPTPPRSRSPWRIRHDDA